MPRRALTRGITVATTTIVLGAGLVPAALLGTAHAAPEGPAVQTAAAAQDLRAAQDETVLPAGSRWEPRQEKLLTAGDTGYLATDEAGTTRWVEPATGAEGPSVPAPGQPNTGLKATLSGSAVTVTDLSTGTATATIAVPSGERYADVFRSDAVLTTAQPVGGPLTLRLLRAGTDGGPATDQPVTGVPDGASYAGPAALGPDYAVIRLSVAGVTHTYLLDFAGASLREIFTGVPTAALGRVIIGGTRVLGYQPGGSTAYTVRLDDPAATVERTPFPAGSAADLSGTTPVPVGDHVLFLRQETTVLGSQPGLGGLAGKPLLSEPVGGGAVQTLLPGSESSYAVAPDGSVLVVGGTGPQDWAVRRVTAAPGADPQLTAVRPLPPVPARILGLAYSAGKLVYASDATSEPALRARTVAPDGTVTDPVPFWNSTPSLTACATLVPCAPMNGLGNGSVAWVQSGTDVVESPAPGSVNTMYTGATGATDTAVSDASGDYVLVASPAKGKQWVIDLRQGSGGNVAVSRTTTAAALWGRTLWVPGAAGKGSVRPYDLVSRAFGTTFQTAATCASFTELQADGRWLYWSCGSSAGVYDWSARRDIPLPADPGPALLGDGFVVRHSPSGALTLTDFHTGTAVSSTLAAVPDGGLADDRGVTWTVDKYGGGVAYADAGGNVHLLPPASVPRQGLSVLRATTRGGALGAAGGSYVPFSGEWVFSRPVGAWTLSFTNAVGQVVATRTGTGAAGGTTVTSSWDLTTAPGRYVPGGRYGWKLTAQPLDGQGAAAVSSGTVSLTGGPARHDWTGDTRGDLLGLTSAGHLDLRAGTSSGGPATSGPTGTGWSTSTTFVPFGDLDQDRVDDLLVRDSAGRLWLFPGRRGSSFTPSQPHVQVGSGFQGYNLLTSAGDLTGDGRDDLVARDTAGNLYLYADNGAKGFAPRVRVGTGFQIYSLLFGAPGTTVGGSPGGLWARDSAGVLWRYSVASAGHLSPRVRIGSGWTMYNTVLSPGDLTGDGLADLLARDPSGALWRYAAAADGHLSTRVRVGTGYGGYRVLL